MQRYRQRTEWPATVLVLAERLEAEYGLDIAMRDHASGATYSNNIPSGVPHKEWGQWGATRFADLRREAELFQLFPEFTRKDRG